MPYFESRLRVNFDDINEIRRRLEFCGKLDIKNLILEPKDGIHDIPIEVKRYIEDFKGMNIYYRYNLKPTNLQDFKKNINLFYFASSWYGGLRNSIRETTDIEIVTDKKRREVLEMYDCYYRYALCNSFGDMQDILYFFSDTYFPKNDKEHSGRYNNIFVKEDSPDKIVSYK